MGCLGGARRSRDPRVAGALRACWRAVSAGRAGQRGRGEAGTLALRAGPRHCRAGRRWRDRRGGGASVSGPGDGPRPRALVRLPLGVVLVKVPVDGLAGDCEGAGDLVDGIAALPVAAGLGVHAPGRLGLPGREPGLAAADRPRARAEARPSLVPSQMRSASISSIAASTWKVNWPATVAVSMPCLSTTRSMPRSARRAAMPVRWRTERAIRDSRVTTSSSPARR